MNMRSENLARNLNSCIGTYRDLYRRFTVTLVRISEIIKPLSDHNLKQLV